MIASKYLSVDYIPVVCTVLLEWANVEQLYRMWTTRTAAGQSLGAWVTVGLALALFAIYYRAKQLTVPFYTTCFGIAMNTSVWLTVLYFHHL